MPHYYISATDFDVREHRAIVNKVVERMRATEGTVAWKFLGYDEDGDAVFACDERIAPKLMEISTGLGAKMYKLSTEEQGLPVIVDRR